MTKGMSKKSRVREKRHAHTVSNTLLGYTGTKFSTWAEPSVTGRPHAAVKRTANTAIPVPLLPTTLNY